MKVFSSSNEFNYTWEEVSTANWRKYCPWNEKTPHVLAVDTLSRHVDADTGILRTERLIKCQQCAPKWLQPFVGDGTSYVWETSYVDPKAQKVTMCSQNMTWSDLLSVQETVVYRRSPKSPQLKTEFDQTAKITALCGGWERIKAKVEQATVDRFAQNAARGKEGFEMVLEKGRRAFAQEREERAHQEARL